MPAMIGRPSIVARSLALLAAAMFLVFVVELSPHLVHHLLPDDHLQPDCPFAALSEREQGSVSEVVTVPVALGLVWWLAASAPPPAVSVAPSPSTARAPPVVA